MSDKYIKQEENIKDCPFCGSSVSVERVPLEHYKGCVTFEIKCLNCGCERTLMKNDSVYRTEEEARANAIAQWNERSSSAAIPHEMSAVEYERISRRFSDWCASTLCAECSFFDDCPQTSPDVLQELTTEQYVAAIQKWAREHPERIEE